MTPTLASLWNPTEFPVKLTVFEGPLDLLIFLIRKNEIDIYDIPMEVVTRQYIDYLETMDHLNLEVAGDFFVMASTLMYIKSRMLLPPREQPPEEEVDEQNLDPRWELVQQLLEYRRYKSLAGNLEDRIEKRTAWWTGSSTTMKRPRRTRVRFIWSICSISGTLLTCST